MNKTTKICSGEYKRTNGNATVSISRQDFGFGMEWIAVADWDNSDATDPLPTKAEAIKNADIMLKEKR